MTSEFKKYVLEHVPTKILLNTFKASRRFNYVEYRDITVNHIIYKCVPVLVQDKYAPVQITVGKFAYWNPYKGHGCDCIYSFEEVKNELSKREHIRKK